jgi:hypothetical protein
MQASCNSEAQFVVALCIYVFIMNPRHVTTFALSFGSTCEEVKGLLPDLHIYLGINFFPIGVKGITRGTQAAEKNQGRASQCVSVRPVQQVCVSSTLTIACMYTFCWRLFLGKFFMHGGCSSPR